MSSRDEFIENFRKYYVKKFLLPWRKLTKGETEYPDEMIIGRNEFEHDVDGKTYILLTYPIKCNLQYAWCNNLICHIHYDTRTMEIRADYGPWCEESAHMFPVVIINIDTEQVKSIVDGEVITFEMMATGGMEMVREKFAEYMDTFGHMENVVEWDDHVWNGKYWHPNKCFYKQVLKNEMRIAYHTYFHPNEYYTKQNLIHTIIPQLLKTFGEHDSCDENCLIQIFSSLYGVKMSKRNIAHIKYIMVAAH